MSLRPTPLLPRREIHAEGSAAGHVSSIRREATDGRLSVRSPAQIFRKFRRLPASAEPTRCDGSAAQIIRQRQFGPAPATELLRGVAAEEVQEMRAVPLEHVACEQQ